PGRQSAWAGFCGAWRTSKAALERLTKELALELAPYGIRVNAVEPGFAPGSSVSKLSEDYVARMNARIPLGTPALKGLRFNRFVTDSQLNTQKTCLYAPKTADRCDPGCDFLLHDGRACDAIEAAFLHDGPAIKKLGVIDELNGLNSDEIRQLRAFLYSL